jgi:hypothetical protein
LLVGALTLSGCAGLTENRYIDQPVEAPPAAYIGPWTGTIGNYLSTLVLNGDGTGRLCSAWHTYNSVERVKFSGGSVYPQSGGEMKVAVAGSQMTGSLPFAGDFRFIRDTELREAASYCQDNL